MLYTMLYSSLLRHAQGVLYTMLYSLVYSLHPRCYNVSYSLVYKPQRVLEMLNAMLYSRF